jgi:hypothetical protein
MPKNIAFFADGTWDEPSNNSNVVKLYSAASNIDGIQLTSYDSGVGTDGNPISDLLGGDLGDGLFQKIKQGYIDIAAQYPVRAAFKYLQHCLGREGGWPRSRRAGPPACRPLTTDR